MRPTTRGWWVLALAAAALGLGLWWRYPGLAAIGGALSLLTVLDATSLVLAGRLDAHRIVAPLEVPRYGGCAGQLTIKHGGRLLAIVAEGFEPVGAEQVRVQAGRLLPGEMVAVSYPVPTARRGRLRVGPLRLRRYGIAGITCRTERASDAAVVRVLPRVLAVRAMPPGARRGHVGAEERVARGGTDLVGLHEYVPGDDLRRVHWATTARTGTLMVREDADPAQAHLAVVLDDRSAAYPDPDSFEHAVEVAASLVRAAYAEGHPVRLRTFQGGLDVELSGPVAGPTGPAHDLLAPLADVCLVDAGDSSPGPLAPPGELDVLALVTGAGADTASLALEASRAEVGAVLTVADDSAQATVVQSTGRVTLLRRPRAEDLLAAWDHTVSARTVMS